MMWRRRPLPNRPYFSQGDQGRPREPALSGGGEDVSDEIASDGDRDVFREGFGADRGCSLHNVRARQHSGWLADTPSSPALDAPQSEGTAVRARAGWSVLRRPRHPKIRARFDQLFSGGGSVFMQGKFCCTRRCIRAHGSTGECSMTSGVRQRPRGPRSVEIALPSSGAERTWTFRHGLPWRLNVRHVHCCTIRRTW